MFASTVLLRTLASSRRAVRVAPALALVVSLSLMAVAGATAAPLLAGFGADASGVISPPGGAAAQIPGLAYVTETATSASKVWLASINGSEPKLLGPGGQPLLAPNGQSVAVALFGATTDSEHGPSLGIYSTRTAPVAVTNYLNLETATATPVAWSPDSVYLAVALQSTAVKNIAAGSGLDVIDTQTGAVVPIANGQIYGASFAQDGTDRVVFARSRSLSPFAASNLYVSNPNGTGLRRLTADGRSLNPVWGPRYIAYDRERLRPQQAPAYEIWLASLSRPRVRKLTSVPAGPLVSGLVPLAFSASGSRLLAEFEGEDTSEAWTVRIASGRARRVTVRGRSAQGAGISSDGNTLLIDENAFEEAPSKGRVATIPFAGGRSTILVAHGAEGSWNG